MTHTSVRFPSKVSCYICGIQVKITRGCVNWINWKCYVSDCEMRHFSLNRLEDLYDEKSLNLASHFETAKCKEKSLATYCSSVSSMLSIFGLSGRSTLSSFLQNREVTWNYAYRPPHLRPPDYSSRCSFLLPASCVCNVCCEKHKTTSGLTPTLEQGRQIS